MNDLRGFALTAERPFPGLRPFDFPDHDFFFGRDDQTAALYLLLDRSRFGAVIGSSGSGKSSLVRAGLLPLLHAENMDARPGGRKWRWTKMHPGDAPLHHFAKCLAELSKDDDPVIGQACRERVEFALHQSRFGVANALSEIDDLENESVVIVVDQFEELFRYAASGAMPGRERVEESRWREEAVHFVQLLLEASRVRSRDVHVLLTMRSDFIGDCARFHGLPEAVSGSQFLVPALTRNQREEVISDPLKKAGASIEAELIEQLLHDSGDEFDQLPVLQHCLSRLWNRAGRDSDGDAAQATLTARVAGTLPAAHRRLTRGQYAAIGGMAGALSEHAEEILVELRRGLEPDDAARLELTVEQLFRALADVDKEGRVTRRSLPFGQLVAETGMPEPEVRMVVDRFRADDCSFVVPPPFEVSRLAAQTRIDVGHEALLRRWHRVSADVAAGARTMGWLRGEEADGRLYRALQSMAETESGRIASDLVERRWKWWNERPRTSAWAERYGGSIESVKRLFVDSLAAREAEIAEQEAEKAAEQRRLESEAQDARDREATALRFARFSRRTAVVVSVLLLVAAGLGVMFFQEQRTAKEQTEFAKQQKDIAEQSFRVTLDTTIALLDRIQKSLDSGAIKAAVAKEWLTASEGNLAKLESLRQTPALVAGRVTLLLGYADTYSTLGDTKLALARSEQALDLARKLVEANPADDAWQHLVYASDFRVGDAAAFQPNHARAHAAFTEALAIARRLAANDPAAGEQRVAFILNKLGDLSKLEGDWEKALRQYRAALEIVQRIADKDPGKPDWQRDLATTRMRIGDLLQERDPEQALEQYSRALPIREKLAHDSDNDGLWSNLSVAYNHVGDMLKAARKYDEALERYNQALTIRRRLAAKDPSNALWQGALAFQYIYIGDVFLLKQDFSGALERYRSALAIRKPMGDQDQENFSWNRNLADNYVRLGDALAPLGQVDDALERYRAGLAIRARLAVDFPSSARQLELAAVRVKIGDILAARNDAAAALTEYRLARDLLAPLAAKNYASSRSAFQDLEQKIAKVSGTL